MKSEKVTDLKEQWIGLFDREEVVAFFDFLWTLDQKDRVQGLCKISEPKKGEAKSNYLSLLFIMDTTDEAMDGLIDSYMKRVPWTDFKKYLSGIDMIIPLPHVSYGTRHYLKEVEIYLVPDMKITRAFIADTLYPAIQKVLPCQGNELIFWEELPRERQHLRIDPVHKGTDRSLVDTIVAYFRGK
jgi:hypothetical protein